MNIRKDVRTAARALALFELTYISFPVNIMRTSRNWSLL